MAKKTSAKDSELAVLTTIKSDDTTETVNVGGMSFAIRRSLPLRDVMRLVDTTVRGCFIDGFEDYRPEVETFAIENSILCYYTDIQMPDDIEEKYNIVMHLHPLTNDEFLQHVNTMQVMNIANAVRTKVEYVCRSNTDNARKQIDAMYADIARVIDNISDAINEIGGDEINKLIDAYNNGAFVSAISSFSKQAPSTGDK